MKTSKIANPNDFGELTFSLVSNYANALRTCRLPPFEKLRRYRAALKALRGETN